MGLPISPQLSCHVLEFTPVNGWVASLSPQVGDRPLSVVGASRQTSTGYLAFLEWGFIVPLGGIMWGTKVTPGGV